MFRLHCCRERAVRVLESTGRSVEGRAVILREEGLACDSSHLGMGFGLGAALRRLGGLLAHGRL